MLHNMEGNKKFYVKVTGKSFPRTGNSKGSLYRIKKASNHVYVTRINLNPEM